jgi:glycosyltransferase involved in cell wall biosynthesis
MAAHWQTEIITTCALDYMTWQNWYPIGTEPLDGTIIRRFPVDQPRDVQQFDGLSGGLCAKGSRATLEEQENWMRAQGPMSSALLEYLQSAKKDYDAFIFFGYLYATTYFGLPRVADRAYLVPLAHDEWPIHFTMWDQFMKLPRETIFSTIEEKQFFRGRFPTTDDSGPVIGIGIEKPVSTNISRFRAKYQLSNPFLLYVGRIDESKGCGELISWFIRLRELRAEPLTLVLIGSEVMAIPYHCDILHLGFVAEQEKWDAMAGCDWLVNPSIYESLSIALLETWAVGRPAVVNGNSEVMVGHCRRSHGGLWYRNFEEWATTIMVIDDPTKAMLGEQGKRYVSENYLWNRVEESYLKLVDLNLDPR